MFPAPNETENFFTLFAKPGLRSVTWATIFQSMRSHLASLKINFPLASRQRLVFPAYLFPSGFTIRIFI